MEIKTICTGTNPNICNAVVFTPVNLQENIAVCEISKEICEYYEQEDCPLKQKLREMFKEFRNETGE